MATAERRKVGGVLVKDGNIISFAWNGTPSGFCNSCEEDGVTKPIVVHAEQNVIAKIAKSTQSSKGSTLYLTASPCYECAKLIIQSEIIRVVYRDEYRVIEPLDFLRNANIKLEHIPKGSK